MKTHTRYRTALIAVTVIILIFVIIFVTGAMKSLTALIHPAPDPHAGQVQINDGFGLVWMTPLEGVDVSDKPASDFGIREGQISYLGSSYTTLRGVDVSEHQWNIDWAKASKEIDFAYIRAGYRGYTEGKLFTDPYFEYNVKAAHANGLLTGVYFFSQAVSISEAEAEANYVLRLIRDYSIDLPIIFDWEKIDANDEARTNDVSAETVTDCARAFCSVIEEAGYDAGIYFNRHLGYYGIDLSLLTDYCFWVSVPGSFPDFYYNADIWQYSFTETVSGIDEPTDMSLIFVPVETSESSAG